MKSGHAMPSTTWRRRGQTPKDSGIRRWIRSWSCQKPVQIRSQILHTTVARTANEVAVRGRDLLRRSNVACLDDIAKTRCKAFDLTFDTISHVHLRAERHMAVGPERVLPSGCSRGVKETWLGGDDERPI